MRKAPPSPIAEMGMGVALMDGIVRLPKKRLAGCSESAGTATWVRVMVTAASDVTAPPASATNQRVPGLEVNVHVVGAGGVGIGVTAVARPAVKIIKKTMAVPVSSFFISSLLRGCPLRIFVDSPGSSRVRQEAYHFFALFYSGLVSGLLIKKTGT
jgi:hypothetical protein